MNSATRPTTRLARALRITARRLDTEQGHYQWSHQGRCNCGHLAQTLTGRTAAEIHALALQKAGDWAQHAVDFCPSSGFPIDHVIGTMIDAGLTTDDLLHLERLSDQRVRQQLPLSQRDLDYRNRHDVVRYMRAWADLADNSDDFVD